MKKLWIAVLAGSLAACASSTPPQAKLDSANRRLAAANALGARCEPRAELHALLGAEQTEKAKKLIEQNEHEKAARLLDRARADAELAIAYAQGAEDRQGCEEWQERLDDTQED